MTPRRVSVPERPNIDMTTAFEPLFIEVDPGPLGQRFAIHHPPQGAALRGLVVYVHPFAEEMNKARRMAALQSRALAEQGFAVLQMDLLGCGDSAGDFGDATWDRWVADVVFACRWLRQRHPTGPAQEAPPLWMWGLRAGCLLAVEAAQHSGIDCNFLFWQPTVAGKTVLQQFLRLKVAGGILSGQAKEATEALRARQATGNPVEVAGYMLHPELCLGIGRAQLRPPAPAGRVEWLELSTREAGALAPVSEATIASWAQAGHPVNGRVVQGPSFWQTTEIEDAPALMAATRRAVTNPTRPGVPERARERIRA